MSNKEIESGGTLDSHPIADPLTLVRVSALLFLPGLGARGTDLRRSDTGNV
jgi:hypothetical protein